MLSPIKIGQTRLALVRISSLLVNLSHNRMDTQKAHHPSLLFSLNIFEDSVMQLLPVSSLFTTLTTLRSCKLNPRSIAFFQQPRLFNNLKSNNNSLLRLSCSTASTSMSDFKRAKLDDSVSTKVIGTHSGSFQADEAMGCFLLRVLPEYRQSKIVRSRDLKILDTCDIVIDVGGTYDHTKLRYDHHQRDYDERFDAGKEGTDGGRCTKLSASGLVYRHYGKEVIQTYYPTLSKEHVDLVYTKLYNSLLEALDAIDTGVEMSENDLLYKDTTGLSSRVARLNPRWNEVDENGNAPDYDERFMEASKICGDDFLSVMTRIVESDLPARDFVEKAVVGRYETDPSGEIIHFPTGGLPWKGHLYELEKIFLGSDPLIKFVLYTDQGGMWRVQAVTVEGKAFENRLSLPKAWRGVRDDDLEKVTKIKGSRFVHAAGFIGGNSNYEGALEMAKQALLANEQ